MAILRSASLLVLALLLLTVVTARGSDRYVAPIEEIPLTSPMSLGARSLGMGGTAMAVADDASATAANPAALARLRRIELSGGIVRSTDDLSGVAFGSDFGTDQSATDFSSARFAYPFPTFRGSLVFGLSADRVFSFDDDFVAAYTDEYPWIEPSGSGQAPRGEWDQVEDYVAGGSIYGWSLGAAFDASETVSLGATFTYYTGSYDRTFRFTAEDVNDVSDSVDTYRLTVADDVDASGLGVTLGTLVYLGIRRLVHPEAYPDAVPVLQSPGERDEQET